MASASTSAPHAQRLVLLDGLRAVAAIGVLLFHVDVAFDNLPLFRHAQLAVDFFFLLSGFVLNASVEQQARDWWGAAGFVVARVGRLWPMMAAASIVGFGVAVHNGQSLQVSLAILMAGLLFMPGNTAREPIFPLNGPQWSLLFELIANVLHAGILWRMRSRLLLVFASLCWTGILALALTKNEIAYGPMYPGWQLGLLRVGFAYTIGCVLARHRDRFLMLRSLPWWLPVAMLVLLLVRPGRPQLLDGPCDALTLLAFVPTLVAAIVAKPPHGLGRAMRLAGAASWPLYAFHSPILAGASWLAARGVISANDAALGAIVMAVGLAFALGHTRLAKGLRIFIAPRSGSLQTRSANS